MLKKETASLHHHEDQCLAIHEPKVLRESSGVHLRNFSNTVRQSIKQTNKSHTQVFVFQKLATWVHPKVPPSATTWAWDLYQKPVQASLPVQVASQDPWGRTTYPHTTVCALEISYSSCIPHVASLTLVISLYCSHRSVHHKQSPQSCMWALMWSYLPSLACVTGLTCSYLPPSYVPACPRPDFDTHHCHVPVVRPQEYTLTAWTPIVVHESCFRLCLVTDLLCWACLQLVSSAVHLHPTSPTPITSTDMLLLMMRLCRHRSAWWRPGSFSTASVVPGPHCIPWPQPLSLCLQLIPTTIGHLLLDPTATYLYTTSSAIITTYLCP